MNETKPTSVPLAVIPALIGRDKATVSRWAVRDRWPLVTWPGRVRGKFVAVAFLEETYGFSFTAEQIAAAELRHEKRLRDEAHWRDQLRKAVRGPQPNTPSLGAVADLFFSHHSDRPQEDKTAARRPPDDPPRL
jgi:hypothetical protein